MPQGAIQVSAAVRKAAGLASAAGAPLLMDPSQALLTGKGLRTALNKTAAAAAMIQTGVGRICKVIVNTAGSAPGSINDSATPSSAAATTVFTIPNVVGIYDVDMPLALGLSLTVGTGQVLSLSYQ